MLSPRLRLSPCRTRAELILPRAPLLPLYFPYTCTLSSRPGGILTVADDLLKNDGQKFLEMMEQLADKRIQREREAAESVDDEDESGEEGSEDEYDEDEEEE